MPPASNSAHTPGPFESFTPGKLQWLAGGFNNLQLDIVGFLAILGEASILTSAPVQTLSPLSILPRLLPAPQALIRSTRPETLVNFPGNVVGARNGNVRNRISHIANLLHSRPPLPKYHVRSQRIYKPDRSQGPKASYRGPLTYLVTLSCLMSLALLILSITLADGFGVVSTILLSLLSSLIGYGSRWSLTLGTRGHNRPLPEDSVVINYPNGSFDVVFCDEDLARELYWHPEECDYRRTNTSYRIVSLVATLTLMFGVICLANASLHLQIAFAAAYMILNAAYWVVAALPPKWHWDLTCYVVEDVTDCVAAEEKKNFTRALWKAIVLTGTSEWVAASRIAPMSRNWGLWAQKAGEEAENWVMFQGKGDREGEVVNVGAKRVRVVWPAWDPDLALTGFLTGGKKEEGGKEVEEGKRGGTEIIKEGCKSD